MSQTSTCPLEPPAGVLARIDWLTEAATMLCLSREQDSPKVASAMALYHFDEQIHAHALSEVERAMAELRQSLARKPKDQPADWEPFSIVARQLGLLGSFFRRRGGAALSLGVLDPEDRAAMEEAERVIAAATCDDPSAGNAASPPPPWRVIDAAVRKTFDPFDPSFAYAVQGVRDRLYFAAGEGGNLRERPEASELKILKRRVKELVKTTKQRAAAEVKVDVLPATTAATPTRTPMTHPERDWQVPPLAKKEIVHRLKARYGPSITKENMESLLKPYDLQSWYGHRQLSTFDRTDMTAELRMALGEPGSAEVGGTQPNSTKLGETQRQGASLAAHKLLRSGDGSATHPSRRA